MSLRRVVLYEEDQELGALLKGLLTQAGFEVEFAQTTLAFFELCRRSLPDHLVIGDKVPDIGLQGLFSVLNTLGPEFTRIPVLVVGDRFTRSRISEGSPENPVEILEKPFEGHLFLERMHSGPASELRVGELVVDPSSQDVKIEGVRVHLTLSEFKLLRELMDHRDEVLTRDHLIERVQGAGIAVIDRAIDTHVFSLRKKLGICGERIETVRGTGYRFRASVAK